MSDSEGYEYIKAHVDCGELSLEYKLKELEVPGRDSHDEDISDWSEDDIRNLVRSMLDLSESEVEKIEVLYH